MVKHEGFQLAVIRSAPERSFQEGPANLHFTFRGIEIAVSGAANHSAGGPLDDGEGAFRFHGAIEVFLKDLRLVAVVFRMLFPNEWIAGGGKERVEVLPRERTQLNEISLQRRLEIKFHAYPHCAVNRTSCVCVSNVQPSRSHVTRGQKPEGRGQQRAQFHAEYPMVKLISVFRPLASVLYPPFL